jgi:phage terminase small subunit
MAKLSAKQRAFVQEYCIDFNATAAAKRAGYSNATATGSASRLLGKAHIQEAVQAQRAKISEAATFDAVWIQEQMREMYDACKDSITPGEKGIASKQLENMGKISGLFIDRHELTGRSNITFNLRTGKK